MFELVIKGGTVFDGSGAEGVRADVGIDGDKVSAIGPDLRGERVLDASGAAVAPGFIDIHTHYDAQVFWDPGLTPSCFHGVTTVVAGNCGFSIAPTRPGHRELIARTLENVEDMDVQTLAAGIPWEFETFPEYLAAVERHGSALNFAAYVGHTPLRLFAMGDDAYERAATPDEIRAMQLVLADSMDAGAAGFATSFAITHRGVDGKPIPSRFCESDELTALLDVMREQGRGVVSIAPGEQCSVPEMYRRQPQVGVPFTYGALLTSPNGRHRKTVELHHEGWVNGAQVWPQVSPRPLGFAFTMAAPFTLNVNTVFAELMAVGIDERRRAYADPAWRQRALDAMDAMRALAPRWETFEIAESTVHPELGGQRLVPLAASRNVSPFNLLLDLALEEPNLTLRVRAILSNDDTDEVQFLLTQEHCTLGLSDAGAHVGQLCDAPLPTDFLGNWVRDRQLMPLATAIRRLTGVQADLFNFPGRGYLRPGYFADVAVFDPNTVAPGPVRRVRDFPANAERLTAPEPVGMHHVVVNGTPIQVDGVRMLDAVGSLPGRVVRPAPRSA